VAQLTITLVSGAIRTLDDTSTVMTPDGPKTAGDLIVGGVMSLFNDGHMPVEIQSIETEE